MSDTTSYRGRCITLPQDNTYGIPFEEIATAFGGISIIVERGEDGDTHYRLCYKDESGIKQSVSFTNSHPLISEPEISWPIESAKRFEFWSWLGEDFDVKSEGIFTFVPKPQHQNRPIHIKTCYTRSNNGCTIYNKQRVYFFVEDVKYPFFTLEICCNI
jgi:hypothetical protein